jgi:hypothetical protein
MSLLLLFQGARTFQSSASQYPMSGTELVFPMVEGEIEPNDDEEVFEIIKRVVKYL